MFYDTRAGKECENSVSYNWTVFVYTKIFDKIKKPFVTFIAFQLVNFNFKRL